MRQERTVVSHHKGISSSRKGTFRFLLALFYSIIGSLVIILLTIIWSNVYTDTSLPIKSNQLKQYESNNNTVHGESPSGRQFLNSNTIQQGKQITQQKHPNAKATIGYAISLTDCSIGDGETPFQTMEGATVLQYSIHQNSIWTPSSGSVYDYQMYAIYHPAARDCTPILAELGYILLEREFPVKVEDIQGEVLRSRIHKNGCCGERELIKLEAFTLTDHPVIVLVDLDVLVLKPLDHLFNLMLDKTYPPSNDHLMVLNKINNPIDTSKELVLPERIDLLYTLDYAMVEPSRKFKPVQGGFVVLRPNQTVFEEYVDIVRRGDFRENGGWGGKMGKFWGAMTFQGLIPFYFHVLNPGRSVEVNWCLYDNMCSPSRADNAKKECFTEEFNCKDCRERPPEDIYLFHFTNCQKPWTCQRFHTDHDKRNKLCRAMHHEWFRTRSQMEIDWGRKGQGPSDHDREHFLGYCKRSGHAGYISIEAPYLPVRKHLTN